jgi:hypothetical protein
LRNLIKDYRNTGEIMNDLVKIVETYFTFIEGNYKITVPAVIDGPLYNKLATSYFEDTKGMGQILDGKALTHDATKHMILKAPHDAYVGYDFKEVQTQEGDSVEVPTRFYLMSMKNNFSDRNKKMIPMSDFRGEWHMDLMNALFAAYRSSVMPRQKL